MAPGGSNSCCSRGQIYLLRREHDQEEPLNPGGRGHAHPGAAHLPSVCQVLGRGAAPGDAPRGRYVVCGDRVPQIQEDMRIFNGLQGNWLFGLKGRNSERHLLFVRFFSSITTLKISRSETILTSLSKNEGHLMYVDFKSHGNNTESGASREFQRLFPICECEFG